MGTSDFTEFAPASVSSSTSNDAVSDSNQRLENEQQSTMPPKELNFTTYSSEDKRQSSETLNYFVEFCAGSAALSAEMKKAGFSVLPIEALRYVARYICLCMGDSGMDGPWICLEPTNNLRSMGHLGA